jgi:hypothetical protein
VDPEPDFYLMRMQIHVPKMMRIHADPDPHTTISGPFLKGYRPSDIGGLWIWQKFSNIRFKQQRNVEPILQGQ